MNRFIALLALIGVSLVAAHSATASDVKAGTLTISAPWARATPKGASIGGGYLRITNTGTAPDRLLGGVSAVAGRIEVHEMSMTGGIMRMRPVTGGLEIKPGETVELKPNGLHLMLLGLKAPLEQDKPFSVTLDFEKAGKVDVSFAVGGIGAMSIGDDHAAPNAPATPGMPAMGTMPMK